MKGSHPTTKARKDAIVRMRVPQEEKDRYTALGKKLGLNLTQWYARAARLTADREAAFPEWKAPLKIDPKDKAVKVIIKNEE